MNENTTTQPKRKKIFLGGASFQTGNMGVSALGESALKCIFHRWPDAEVNLLGGELNSRFQEVVVNGKKLQLKTYPLRFSKNIFLSNHFFILVHYAFFLKIFPFKWFKNFCMARNEFVKEFIETDIVVDITGGDSFTDIYGMKRFTVGFLRKWLSLFFNIPLVFLPQTYGPFNNRISRFLVKSILKKSTMLYSRDQDSVDYLEKILSKRDFIEKVRLIPDVAFTLDPNKPDVLDVGSLLKKRKKDNIVVGINISGLLYNGGYTQDNMFNLKVNYKKLVYDLIDLIMTMENTLVLLIPHVFPFYKYDVESDPEACLDLYNSIVKKYMDRIFLVNGVYNQNEIKYIIGLTDFFMGSRMHSCIAAVSQCIPAVGLAYSKKFLGVFDSVGVGRFVVDMRLNTEEEILASITKLYKEREITAKHLRNSIPGIKDKIINLLQVIK